MENERGGRNLNIIKFIIAVEQDNGDVERRSERCDEVSGHTGYS